MGDGSACKCGCYDSKFTAASRKQYFDSFWGTGDKTQQDQVLMCGITKRDVKRRRTRDPNQPDKLQYTYTVTVGGEAIVVCRNTYMALHGIKEGKLRIIMGMKKDSTENIAKPDMRGKSK